jgi:hypothetical protein
MQTKHYFRGGQWLFVARETRKGVSMERFPSIETLMRIPGCTREVATKIRAIMKGELDPRTIEQTDRWVRTCFHDPHIIEQRLHAIDVLLDTHGVEALGTSESTRWPQYSYCNAGDPYALTVIRNHARGSWYVGAWSDIVENGKVRE